MTDPIHPKQADQLIADYLAGSLSDADRPVFEDWLRASPKHPQLVARLSITDFCIRELCQDTKSDYLLDILNQIDQASGPAQLVTLHHLESPWQRYRIHAAWGAIAAALLLAAALWAILQTGPQPQTLTHNTPTQNKPAESAQPIPRDHSTTPVATLTATHNATWGRPASAGPENPPKTGSKLHPNQRLTLTAGFAEITTARGAVALIQAPATIELLDNDNALRLHAGKLVGICETDSSKGFLVRTPHLDITDLGTEFGVDASQQDSTEVHVFKGEVELVRAGISTVGQSDRINLIAGQSAALDHDADQILRIAFNPSRLAALVTNGALRHSLSTQDEVRLDLVDLIAGGNGTEKGRMVGLDPRNGKMVREGIFDLQQAHFTSPERIVPVPSNPVIDCIFIPHHHAEVEIDSTGRVVRGLSVTVPQCYQFLWAGGLIPSVRTDDALRSHVAQLYPDDPYSAPVLYMMSNKGITLDLDAIRALAGVRGPVHFETKVEKARRDQSMPDAGKSDFSVYLDGQLIDKATGLGKPHNVLIRADENQRYMTIVVSDGGDGLSYDWVLLHRPTLSLDLNHKEKSLSPSDL